MEIDSAEYLAGAGGVIFLMLPIIAYLLKFLLQDFRALQQNLYEVQTRYQFMEVAMQTMSKKLKALRLQLQKEDQPI
jgi:cytochrome c-type biogenesis protein CcmH/NrfG